MFDTDRLLAWLCSSAVCALPLVPAATCVPIAVAQEELAPVPDVSTSWPLTCVETGYNADVWDRYFRFVPLQRSVTLHSRERSSPQDPWERQTREYTTTFRVTAVGSVDGGHTIYVAGYSDEGEAVIERWSFELREGGYRVVLPPLGSTSGGGGGVLTPTLQRVVAGGGAWRSTQQSPGSLTPARGQIYRRPGGLISALSVDQHRRYLVFYDAANEELVQLDLADSAAPEQTLLVASAYAPSFDVVHDVELRDFLGTPPGRTILILSEMDLGGGLVEVVRALVRDPENDGTFETSDPPTILVGDALWKQTPYAEEANWDRFVYF
jgi:hypothetical protein